MGLLLSTISFECAQPFQSRQAGHEKVFATAKDIERLDPVTAKAHRLVRNREDRILVLQADDWITLVAEPHEVSLVNPLLLQEFHRRHRLGADEEEVSA